MTTTRDIMTAGAECIKEGETLEAAAQKMRDLNVGALPICGSDDRLKGVISDRDIVVKCLAEGGDARTMLASELAQGKPHTIGADDDVDDAIALMERHQVRRLPVIEDQKLVGMLSQADIARHLPERIGALVKKISS